MIDSAPTREETRKIFVRKTTNRSDTIDTYGYATKCWRKTSANTALTSANNEKLLMGIFALWLF